MQEYSNGGGGDGGGGGGGGGPADLAKLQSIMHSIEIACSSIQVIFLTFYFIFFSLFGSEKVQENFKSHVLCFLGNERENYCLPWLISFLFTI